MPSRATARTPSRRRAGDGDRPQIDDTGLLSPAETCLLTDQYELAMASSYLGQGMNDPAVFELFVRHLPPRRDWLLVAGVGPALSLVEEMRFGPDELTFLREQGFAAPFLEYLERFHFSGSVDAMPEGTIAFAGEPLLRVTAPRVEAQLIETLLLNQINFHDLGTSRDSPAVGGVYKLVADRADGIWRPVAKRSPAKATLPGPKQVFRSVACGVMLEDTLAIADERLPGRALLVPAMCEGRVELGDSLSAWRARAASELRSLPRALRDLSPATATGYRVRLSDRLAELTAAAQGITDPRELRRLREPIEQHGTT